MRLLVESYGDVRVFKDRSLIGLPRYIIETIDPDFNMLLISSNKWTRGNNFAMYLSILAWISFLFIPFDDSLNLTLPKFGK